MEGREVTLELLGTTEQEIAYMAGLFDGEGNISAGRLKEGLTDSYRVYTRVEMTVVEPLFPFKRIFGGSIKVYPPKGRRMQSYKWCIGGKKVEIFLKTLEPYLIVKKDKALLALSLLAFHRTGSPQRQAIAEKISIPKATPDLS